MTKSRCRLRVSAGQIASAAPRFSPRERTLAQFSFVFSHALGNSAIGARCLQIALASSVRMGEWKASARSSSRRMLTAPAIRHELGFNTPMGKLNATDTQDNLEIHLPVRNRALLARYRMTLERTSGSKSHCSRDLGQAEACRLASLVSGRILLYVAGISKNRQGLLEFRFRDSDV